MRFHWPTTALLIIVLTGYGLGLGKAWSTASKARSDSQYLEELIRRELAEEPGTLNTRTWLGRGIVFLPIERGKKLLLEHADDPRPGIRFLVNDWILDYFRSDERAWTNLSEYLGNPRETAIFRWMLFQTHPDLKDTFREAWESLRRQFGLFPGEEPFEGRFFDNTMRNTDVPSSVE